MPNFLKHRKVPKTYISLPYRLNQSLNRKARARALTRLNYIAFLVKNDTLTTPNQIPQHLQSPKIDYERTP